MDLVASLTREVERPLSAPKLAFQVDDEKLTNREAARMVRHEQFSTLPRCPVAPRFQQWPSP